MNDHVQPPPVKPTEEMIGIVVRMPVSTYQALQVVARRKRTKPGTIIRGLLTHYLYEDGQTHPVVLRTLKRGQ